MQEATTIIITTATTTEEEEEGTIMKDAIMQSIDGRACCLRPMLIRVSRRLPSTVTGCVRLHSTCKRGATRLWLP